MSDEMMACYPDEIIQLNIAYLVHQTRILFRRPCFISVGNLQPTLNGFTQSTGERAKRLAFQLAIRFSGRHQRSPGCPTPRAGGSRRFRSRADRGPDFGDHRWGSDHALPG